MSINGFCDLVSISLIRLFEYLHVGIDLSILSCYDSCLHYLWSYLSSYWLTRLYGLSSLSIATHVWNAANVSLYVYAVYVQSRILNVSLSTSYYVESVLESIRYMSTML